KHQFQAPSANIQAPENLQEPSSNFPRARSLIFDAWSFSGAWCLEFGALMRSFSGCWSLEFGAFSFALLQRHHPPLARSGVFGQRTNEPVVRELLHHVRRH